MNIHPQLSLALCLLLLCDTERGELRRDCDGARFAADAVGLAL